MRTDRRVLIAFALLSVAVVATARAHTMFLKLESFFLEPNTSAVVALLNGDFDLSENVIARDRMTDVSVVGPDGVVHPPTSAWRDTAMFHWNADSVDTALLEFETGSAGTYVLGVSSAPTVFTLADTAFNDYLVHDGIVDALAERERKGLMDEDATERYSKHVKAIIQVGDERTGHWEHELGYPVEFIPLRNPYELSVGDALEVRFLRNGQPVPNQIVYANHEYNHQHDDAGGHVEAVTTRTDGYGIARIELSAGGRWYVKTIHMVERESEPAIDYESNWATLTFEIR
ncbi:MAG: DUF4198 domain-containing protein [Gemmatimonadota bacterium]|nr:DUF4198 domain-containing protein [Gemmatimonadota bacterium]